MDKSNAVVLREFGTDNAQDVGIDFNDGDMFYLRGSQQAADYATKT